MSLNTVNKETGELITTANGTRIWCGSKTAHDIAVQQGTMPNNCMVCITDDAPGEEAWQYSTNETRTGKTWIDGKPIYRKVLIYDAPPGAINLSSLDIEELIVYYGHSTVDDTYQIPLIYSDTVNSAKAFWDKSTHRLTISSTGNGETVVIIEYTKTTDA